MNTTYKIINCDTSEVVKENLEFYAARAFMGDSDNLCMMEMDADVEDRLERRRKLIAVQESN